MARRGKKSQDARTELSTGVPIERCMNHNFMTETGRQEEIVRRQERGRGRGPTTTEEEEEDQRPPRKRNKDRKETQHMTTDEDETTQDHPPTKRNEDEKEGTFPKENPTTKDRR
ncbi:hypothetical protein K440DRAFT_639295 [Wilcoxina mikolae CBS 423.85]|nr:hypothetical protein K440DRAFT_639295 [Wilcoxina mikolae CBS 423.85]